jgi:hypothetical protein
MASLKRANSATVEVRKAVLTALAVTARRADSHRALSATLQTRAAAPLNVNWLATAQSVAPLQVFVTQQRLAQAITLPAPQTRPPEMATLVVMDCSAPADNVPPEIYNAATLWVR